MAAVNFAILIVAWLLQRRMAPLEVVKRKEKKSFFTLLPKDSPTYKKLILVSCGIIGFTSITSEVVWNKYLGIFMGSKYFWTWTNSFPISPGNCPWFFSSLLFRREG